MRLLDKPEDMMKDASKKGLPLLHMVLWAVAGALLVGGIAIVVFGDLAGGSLWPLPGHNPPAIDSSRWYDVVRSAVGVVGLAGLGGGAIIAYRRQQTAERRQMVEEARQKTESARQATEEARSALERDRHQFEIEKRQDSDIADLRSRYAKAAEQLGHQKAAVRLAGVYAMTALSDDWLGIGNLLQQKVCIDVLCAYLRMPYDPSNADSGEKEVRLTILGVIRDKLQDPHSSTSWCRMSLDFTGAVIDGGSLSGAEIQGKVLFDRAKFIQDFDAEKMRLIRGELSFVNAEFANSGLSLQGTRVQGGRITFKSAKFADSNVVLSKLSIEKGNVNFNDIKISSGVISFGESVIDSGLISIDWPKMTGGHISFSGTDFKGGKCSIYGWSFEGGQISFPYAKFLGTVVNLEEIDPSKDSDFTLDLTSPRKWTVPPKVPGRLAVDDPPWRRRSADDTGPAPWILPQKWPPAEEEPPF